jgi:hypothetical protein
MEKIFETNNYNTHGSLIHVVQHGSARYVYNFHKVSYH